MRAVVVFGASGYSGLELLGLLAAHPHVEVVAASSDRWAGEPVAERVKGWPGALAFASHEATLATAAAGQLAFLCTPAKTSLELAPVLLERGLRVIDLSGAFRLDDVAEYPGWYGFAHPRPDLLGEARYAIPELLPIDAPADARLVANPGCYATAAILAVAPLLRAGLTAPGAPVVIDGKSGATGAGRTLEEGLLFSEVQENLRPYRIARHQHTPEIERALRLATGRPVRVSFTAHLVPMRRGLLASAYVAARDGVTQADVDRALDEAWAGAPLVRRSPRRPPETGAVQRTPFAEVHAVLDDRARTLAAFAAIDNLGKGAASQAVQNMNALLGVEGCAGLLPPGRG